jgi:hypothetical protein
MTGVAAHVMTAQRPSEISLLIILSLLKNTNPYAAKNILKNIFYFFAVFVDVVKKIR